MLPVNSGSHTAYQNFVLENLRIYYPDPTVFSKSVWDIIERFWLLDLSYTDELLRSKYSVLGPKPRTPSCMQCSYLLSIDFKILSLPDWAAQLKIPPPARPCAAWSRLATLPGSVRFMISSTGFGILILTTFPRIFIL